MLSVHPQFITDTAGKKLVVLPLKEFELILRRLQEQRGINFYTDDIGKENITPTRITISHKK